MPEPNGSRRFRRVRPSIVVGATLILVFGVLYALATVRALLLLSFFGLLVATILRYPIVWLGKLVPRAVAVVLTAILIVAIVVGVAWFVVPTVFNQLEQLWNELPTAIAGVDRWLAHVSETTTKSPTKAVAQSLRERLASELAALVPQAIPLAKGTAEVVSAFVFVIVLGLFVAANPDAYEQGVVSLVPPERRPVVRETLRRLHEALRHWMVGILVAMLMMGTFTAVGLWLAGVNGWLALGLLTFFGTFVPYLGAIASAIPGLLVALSESTTRFLWACVVYLAVHLLEGYIVEPLIMKRAVSLRPGMLIVWQLLIGGLFGWRGIIVATPLLACVKVIVEHLWVERTLGEAP